MKKKAYKPVRAAQKKKKEKKKQTENKQREESEKQYLKTNKCYKYIDRLGHSYSMMI